MRIDQARKRPVIFRWGGEQISAPKFLRGDWVAFGAKLDAEREDRLTKGMSNRERFAALAFTPIQPLTLDELRARTLTGAGVEHIVKTCLARASVIKRDGVKLDPPELVTKERAEALYAEIADAEDESLEMLAAMLADIIDRSRAENAQAGKGGATLGEEGKPAESPLTPPPAA